MPSIHILITFFIKQQILNRGIRCVCIYIYIPNLINLFWLWFTIRISTWQKGSCRSNPAAPLPEVLFQFSLDLLPTHRGRCDRTSDPPQRVWYSPGRKKSWKRQKFMVTVETWKTHGNHYKQWVKTWLKHVKQQKHTKNKQKQTKKQQKTTGHQPI